MDGVNGWCEWVLCDVWSWAMGCVCAEVLWRGAVKVQGDVREVL